MKRAYFWLLALTVALAVALVIGGANATQPPRAASPVGSIPRLEPTRPQVPTAPLLVGAGDIGMCNSQGAMLTAQLIQGIRGNVFTAGDNAYDNGTAQEFQTCYDPYWGPFKSVTRPSPGNHDYNSPNAQPYYDYFGANAGQPGVGYYSYDLGSWHIISLNSNIDATAGSPQEQWLRADLASHSAICTLAYWHHPLYTSGLHGNDSRTHDIWQALYAARADLVISGHDHDYERFAPQNADGQAQPTRGIREFVVGTGGAELRDFTIVRQNSEARIAQVWGVIKLQLFDGRYSWQFISTNNQILDSGKSNCVL